MHAVGVVPHAVATAPDDLANPRDSVAVYRARSSLQNLVVQMVVVLMMSQADCTLSELLPLDCIPPDLRHLKGIPLDQSLHFHRYCDDDGRDDPYHRHRLRRHYPFSSNDASEAVADGVHDASGVTDDAEDNSDCCSALIRLPHKLSHSRYSLAHHAADPSLNHHSRPRRHLSTHSIGAAALALRDSLHACLAESEMHPSSYSGRTDPASHAVPAMVTAEA